MSANFIKSHISEAGLLSTGRIEIIMGDLPERATIRDPSGYDGNVGIYEYTEKYVVKRNIKTSLDCSSGDYIIAWKY